MEKKKKFEPNVPLEPGDYVVCLKMVDDFSPIPGGTPGVVTSVSEVFGQKQYYVKWKNKSSLALIEGVDQWAKTGSSKDTTNESVLFVKTKKEILKEIKNKN
jgi:hypothetical protein